MGVIDERVSVLILEVDRCRTAKSESLRNAILWSLMLVLLIGIAVFVWNLPTADPMRRRTAASVVALIGVIGGVARNIARYRRAKCDLAVYEAALDSELAGSQHV
ncbi:MAG: hypothetical protein AB2L09_08190 [Coriobacteriia bacterium]